MSRAGKWNPGVRTAPGGRPKWTRIQLGVEFGEVLAAFPGPLQVLFEALSGLQGLGSIEPVPEILQVDFSKRRWKTVPFRFSTIRGNWNRQSASLANPTTGTVKLSRICPFCGRILLDQKLRINDLAVAAGGENAAKLLNLTVPLTKPKHLYRISVSGGQIK